ncbi:caspase family protein [Hankyongella ginsenosidimutans]|uniref:caspase family protein n=1 Tax=Hankyongella ginsenosidimutans TaxID=1763828 RepID=UPI001CA360DA|nr:caspase family protein [Hankyongella ginsenosidimutans]
MPFRGLFIGIDRYSSTGIDELTCARRDATALEALFFDTLGGSTVLLADAEATRQRIEDAFGDLAGCGPEDTVVIAFSGHGSETHELVTHDAIPMISPALRSRSSCCRNGSRGYRRSA